MLCETANCFHATVAQAPSACLLMTEFLCPKSIAISRSGITLRSAAAIAVCREVALSEQSGRPKIISCKRKSQKLALFILALQALR